MRSTPRSADRDGVPAPDTTTETGTVRFERIVAWLLLIGGVAGSAAAFLLTIEKFMLEVDPLYMPSCSISPVLNCGSVMETSQASVFGFPNSLLGISGFAVVASTGAALLAGAQLARWYWLGLQAGVAAGALFVHWLIFQSLYTIGALCPYCMVVWAVTVPIFWYTTLHNFERFAAPKQRSIFTVITSNHAVPLTVWALVVVALIAHRFWSYWSGLL
ncbi:vitamin K epoxide reductase family protein [Antrihabitans sp. NCIMB 15449]|uniref:Vitamin K epoxide reductase family protein n=1 Tax=Antrihabitans spumae TaxID=3373370 RepID=A0ABW7JQV6_9NOCA